MQSGDLAAVPKVQLQEVLTKSLISELVDAVATKRQNASPPVRDTMNELLAGLLLTRGADMGGARTPDRISPVALRRSIHFRHTLRLGDIRAHFAALVWAESRSDDLEAARTVARSAGLPVVDTATGVPESPELESAELERLAAELRRAAPHLSEDQAKLLMWIVCAPRSPVQDSPLFARWLDDLEKAGTNAAEWDRLPAFVEMAKRRREALQNNEAAGRALERLTEALSKLNDTDVQSGLKAAALEGALRWTAPDFKEEEREAAASAVDSLAQGLRTLAELFGRRPNDVTGAAVWYARVTELTEQIRGRLSEVESHLQPTSPPNPIHEQVVATQEVGNPSLDAPPPPVDDSPAKPTPDPVSVNTERPITPAVATVLEPKLDADEGPVAKATIPIEVQAAAERPAPAPAGPPAPPPPPEPAAVLPPPAEDLPPPAVTEYAQRTDNHHNVIAAKSNVIHEPRVLPRHVAAQRVVDDPSSSNSGKLLLALIWDGDYSGAYWIARAVESRGDAPPYPSWLLSALAGADFAAQDSAPLTTSLLEVARANEVPQDHAAQLLACAAAVRAVLDAPLSGMSDWLDLHGEPLGAKNVLRAVRTFATNGLPLPLDLQSSLQNGEERASKIEQAARSARRFLDEAPSRSTAYQMGTLIWTDLAKGPIAEFLEPVAQNRRSALSVVDAGIRTWSDRSHIDREITSVLKQRRTSNQKPIVGGALKKLYQLVEEACQTAAEWRDLIATDERVTGQGNWLTQQVQHLTTEVKDGLPHAMSSAQHLSQTIRAAEVATASQALFRSLSWLGHRTLGRQSIPYAVDVQRWRDLMGANSRLPSLLAQRLLALPDLRLPQDGAAWNGAIDHVPLEIAKEILEDRSIESALSGWIQRRDFRFTAGLLSRVPDAAQEKLRGEHDSALSEAKAALRDRLQKLTGRIEKAVVDGIIQDERAALTARIDIDPDATLRFDECTKVLDEVDHQLKQAREKAVARHRTVWEQLRPRIRAPAVPPEALAGLDSRLEEVFRAGDIRGADELLAHLRSVIQDGNPFNAVLFEGPRPDKTLEEFLESIQTFQDRLKMIRGRQVDKELDTIQSAATADARREFHEVWPQWLRLCDGRAHPERLAEPLAGLFRYLGFQLPAGTGAQAFTPPNKDETNTIFQANLRTGERAPVPQVGSKSEGRYRVVCVWPRDGVDVLAMTLARLRPGDAATVVLYFGRMSPQQRKAARAQSRNAGEAVLVLDEWLLLFLERHAPEFRLRAFFSCVLPWSHVNPYAPRGGAVAPEMFFGRSDMAKELASLAGTCLVYGGRQLGKSALLDHVKRQFERTGEARVAVRLDIKDLGDPAIDRSHAQIWGRLRDALKERRFLYPQVTSDRPGDIADHIRKNLGGEKHRQLLVLFDEADNFLQADAAHGFEQVLRFRELMEETHQLCKFVFAGLHHVQRFQGIANQPLAHFGAALPVGPLEPKEAVRLITEPLSALGFRFEEGDQSAILRILSYTNYHPGLIQLFCRQLLQSQETRVSTHSPPHLVRDEDVEEVYRSPKVADQIRERFGWTLALDSRYEVITYALIVKQAEDEAGYGQTYPASAVLDLARGWRKESFAHMHSDEFRGLLDEMVGLGVLVRTADNKYRLRSPNVVRLLGTMRDIESKLLELSHQPEQRFDADSHRYWLDKGKGIRPSPFTFAQERQIREGNPGAILVFGSRATHLEHVPGALENIASQLKMRFVVAPEKLNDPKQFAQWLKEAAKSGGDVRTLLIHHPLTAKTAASGELVDAAHATCRQLADEKNIQVRCVFSVDPAGGFGWLSEAVPKEAHRGNYTVLTLKRLSFPNVRKVLERAEIFYAGDETPQRLARELTGGWPVVLLPFVQEHARSEAVTAIERFEPQVAKGGERVKALREALALDDVPKAWGALAALSEFGAVEDLDEAAGVLDAGGVQLDRVTAQAVLELLVRLDCLEHHGGKLQVAPLLHLAAT